MAMTRAEKGLYLSGAEGRNFDGSPRYPSRFVLDIDDGLLEYDPPRTDTLIEDAREYIAGRDRFLPEDFESGLCAEGERVIHAILGEGTVIELDRTRNAYLIKFDGLSTPRKISMKVKLTKA